MRERRAQSEVADGQLVFEAFYSYLLPQFEGIDEVQGQRLFAELRRLGGNTLAERLRTTLVTVLGLESLEQLPQGIEHVDLEDAVVAEEPIVTVEPEG
jgi:hypothetical protein